LGVFTVYEAVELFQKLMIEQINTATDDEQLKAELVSATEKIFNIVITDFESHKLKG